MALRFLILTLIFLLLDWYFYQAVVTVLRFATPERKQMVAWIYWGFSAFVVVLMLVAVAIGPLNAPRWVRVYLFSVVLVVEISKLVGLVFVFTDDVLRLFRWLAQLVLPKSAPSEGSGISRLRFLNQMALVMAAIPFASLHIGPLSGSRLLKFNHGVVLAGEQLVDGENHEGKYAPLNPCAFHKLLLFVSKGVWGGHQRIFT